LKGVLIPEEAVVASVGKVDITKDHRGSFICTNKAEDYLLMKDRLQELFKDLVSQGWFDFLFEATNDFIVKRGDSQLRSSLGFKLYDGLDRHFGTLKTYEKTLDMISR